MNNSQITQNRPKMTVQSDVLQSAQSKKGKGEVGKAGG